MLFLISPTFSIKLDFLQQFQSNNVSPLQSISATFHRYPPGSELQSAPLSSQSIFDLQTLSTSSHPMAIKASEFNPISPMSTADENPNQLDPVDSLLYPFGKYMQFSYQLFSQNAQILFSLQIDDKAGSISHNMTKPTSFELNGEVFYPVYSVFKGSGINPSNNETYQIILSVLPHLGDYDYQPAEENNIGVKNSNRYFETQNFDILSAKPFIILPQDSYTIQAVITKPSGKMFQISSSSSLIKQKQSNIRDLQAEQTTLTSSPSSVLTDPFHQQQLGLLSTQIESLSGHLWDLFSIQQDTAHDLVLFDLSTDVRSIFQHLGNNNESYDPKSPYPPCVVSASNDYEINIDDPDQGGQNNDIIPGFEFKRWNPCHRYSGSTVIFTVDAFVSHSYAVFVSDSVIVSEQKIIATLQFLFSIFNLPYHQQLGIVWQLGSIIIRTSPSDELWNVSTRPDELACLGQNASHLLESFAQTRQNNPSYSKSSLNHLFFTCPIRSGSYIAGLHKLDGICLRDSGVGWSMIKSPSSWIIPAHELFHSIGGLHPFLTNQTLMGKFGSIIDYDNHRLSDTNPYDPEASKRYGFSFDLSHERVCSTLEKTFVYRDHPSFVPNCFQLLHFPEDISPAPIKSDSKASKIVHSADNVLLPTCGNGFVEPYEDCDVENACCQDCKYTPQSTCDGTSLECCQDCQMVSVTSRRCTIDGIHNGGICMLGKCVEMWTPDRKSLPNISKCPDATFFSRSILSQNCAYTLPTDFKSCEISNGIRKEQDFVIGTSCTAVEHNNNDSNNSDILSDSTLGNGICLPVISFNQIGVVSKCFALNQTSYIWSWKILRGCDCSKQIVDTTGTWMCMNAAGLAVSESYCGGVVKPEKPKCNCQDGYYIWEYQKWGTEECGYSDCNKGVQYRGAKCLFQHPDEINVKHFENPHLVDSILSPSFHNNQLTYTIINTTESAFHISSDGFDNSPQPKPSEECISALGMPLLFRDCEPPEALPDCPTSANPYKKCEWNRGAIPWYICREKSAPFFEEPPKLYIFVLIIIASSIGTAIIIAVVFRTYAGRYPCSKEDIQKENSNQLLNELSIPPLIDDQDGSVVFQIDEESQNARLLTEDTVDSNSGDDH
jgi:hypothetical protein